MEVIRLARKGLPAKYAKMGFKKGWKAYKASKKKSPSRTRKTRRKGGRKTMARRYRRKRRGGGKSIARTAMKWIRVGALVANPVRIAMINASWEDKVTWIFQDYTGFNIQDGSFEAGRLAKGWGPYALACLTTYGIPKLASIIRRL